MIGSSSARAVVRARPGRRCAAARSWRTAISRRRRSISAANAASRTGSGTCGRGLAPATAPPMATSAERDAAAEQHVAGPVGGERADQGGRRPTTTSDPVVAWAGRLPEDVDEHRHREDGAAAAERAQAEPDERAGDDGAGARQGHASGPDQVQPDLAALSKESSIATSVPAGGVEQRRGDRGAVAAGAVHPDLARRDLVQPARQLVERDVDRAVDAGGGVLVGAAHVEDDHLAVVADLGQVGEGRGRERRELAGRSSPRARRWRGRPGGRCRCGPARAAPRRRPRRSRRAG